MEKRRWSRYANELKTGHKMEVIERRMRVGVHNGLAYISSPLTVHLVPQEELMTGTQSLRRKARTSAKGQNPPSSSSSLVVRSRISLPIVKDPRFALVFSIDFLLGVRAADGTVSQSQSVMVGWGIALPFSSDPTAFYLTGGPRANPDEVLCFKSLQGLRGRGPHASLADGRRDLSLAFHFYLADEAPHPSRPLEPECSDEEPEPERRTKPEIREPEPEPQPEVVEIDEEIIHEPEEEEELVPVSRREGRRAETRKPERSDPERPERERDRLPPSDGVTSYREHIKMENVYDSTVPSIQPLARSSLAFLSATSFCKISDRNGDAPTLVDPMDTRPIDIAIERNDRLATAEIVLQLLAMKWNTQEKSPARVYFTFQFFRIPMITTEILSIDTRDSILRRLQMNNQGEYPAGFTAKITIDRASLSSSEELATFLATGEVSIEAWDADSMIPLGSATLPLRSLCRRGTEAVQFYAECSVLQAALPIPARTVGTLYVRAANIGHPFSNQMDLTLSHSSSFIAYSLPSIGHSSSGKKVELYLVRAKPLSASHQSSLQRFIQSQRIDMHRRYAEILNEQNLKSIGDWEALKKKVPGSAHHESSLKRFIFEGELEAYRKARGESKANKLLAAVFKGLTVSHSFSVSLGEVHVFEFMLSNPFPNAVNCSILMDDASLSIVHQEEEWESWKRSIKHPTEEKKVDSTIFKRGLTRDASNLLYLRPNEPLLIPFKYDGLKVSSAAEEGAEGQVKVIFKEVNSGEPLSVLDLHIQKRPYALSRAFRFLADEATNFEKHIRMRDKRRVQSIRCSDPSAKVSLVQDRGGMQVVRITAYMGPALTVRKLIVFLYEDAYCHRLTATWKVEVHAVTRVDTHSVQGQTTNVQLPVYVDNNNTTAPVFVHSSSTSIRLPHPQPLELAAGARSLAVQHTSTALGTHISLLSLTSDQSLVNMYALHAHIRAPHVSSSYAIRVDSRTREPVVKRLAVHNSYSIPRSFRLVSSHPNLMRPLTEVINLPPEGVISPPLQFLPVDFSRRTIEMHLFIQDADTGQEEETYALKVVYEPM
ncbi:hypothetical protein PMAYCL1PPCAC_26835 [Pristionchus mayeri]|uniref:Nephrocystin-4 n=1 Tax=Pristionchus mayeri TaxID=1317129 RepID=A0AAN5IA30_9BILA|nr:hypothetical protein PMAYCL1PPCAC_26835 [Pristionchus mayeri]